MDCHVLYPGLLIFAVVSEDGTIGFTGFTG
jgi:hypothetical protein